jgi:hypothetical protein
MGQCRGPAVCWAKTAGPSPSRVGVPATLIRLLGGPRRKESRNGALGNDQVFGAGLVGDRHGEGGMISAVGDARSRALGQVCVVKKFPDHAGGLLWRSRERLMQSGSAMSAGG